MDYDSIILDCTMEVQDFRRVICELDMPQVNMRSALEKVFHVVSNLHHVEDQLARLAFEMSEGEALFENLQLDNGAQDRLIMAVVRLGNAVKNKLISYHAYRHNTFPYSFRTILNDNTIVLQKRSAYNYPRPRYPGYHGIN